jgi:hypothetical protein
MIIRAELLGAAQQLGRPGAPFSVLARRAASVSSSSVQQPPAMKRFEKNNDWRDATVRCHRRVGLLRGS